MHTPSIWGQRSLGGSSVVHTLRQPVVGPKLFVIRHHIPLLPPVSGFSNLFHLTGGAIYTFLLLMSRKGKQACQDRRERKTAGQMQLNAQKTSLVHTQEAFSYCYASDPPGSSEIKQVSKETKGSHSHYSAYLHLQDRTLACQGYDLFNTLTPRPALPI